MNDQPTPPSNTPLGVQPGMEPGTQPNLLNHPQTPIATGAHQPPKQITNTQKPMTAQDIEALLSMTKATHTQANPRKKAIIVMTILTVILTIAISIGLRYVKL